MSTFWIIIRISDNFKIRLVKSDVQPKTNTVSLLIRFLPLMKEECALFPTFLLSWISILCSKGYPAVMQCSRYIHIYIYVSISSRVYVLYFSKGYSLYKGLKWYHCFDHWQWSKSERTFSVCVSFLAYTKPKGGNCSFVSIFFWHQRNANLFQTCKFPIRIVSQI